MHVVFVTPYFSPKVGGLENYALEIASGLAQIHGWKISVITSNHASSKYSEDSVGALKVYRLKNDFHLSNTPVGLTWKRQIKALLTRLEPDIVNAHTPVPFISDLALQAATELNIPCVLTYHNDIFKENPVLKLIGELYYILLGNKTLTLAQAIVVSSSHYAQISPYLHAFKKKIHVIPPGVHNVPLIKSSGDKNSIIFVAQLDKTHRHKGLEILLSAVSQVVSTHPNITLTVIGKGDDANRYRKLSKNLHIQNNVSFKGFVSESTIARHFSDAICLCLPSTSQAEGFGMVILEAASQKTPSIGSDVGGIPAVILNGETGILVPPSDSKALADAIIKLYEDRSLRDTLGERAHTRVRNEFSWAKQVEKTKQLFEEIAHT